MTEQDGVERPPCPVCRVPYMAGEAARHTQPIACEGCYRCKGQPACYTCGHMYCACTVHEHG